MKKNWRKKVMGTVLWAVMLMNFSGCAGQSGVRNSVDLMGEIRSAGEGNRAASDTENTGIGAAAVTDFGIRLMQDSYLQAGEENVLLSPVSVIYALAMTANGAKGETLAQMENVLGMTMPELNIYLSAYRQTLSQGEKYKLSMANAIWFKDSGFFNVEQNFLQTNADYYNAELYKAPFDNSTLKDINNWVKENTDGMIEQILNRIQEEDVMYLVNALAFDAEWETIYQKNQIRDGVFTMADGNTQNTKFMYTSVYQYLTSEQAEGFLKYYAGGKYAFGALLPAEGVTIQALLDSLTGEKLNGILSNPVEVKVNTAIPQFESGYSIRLDEILQRMGLQDAFEAAAADFSGIGYSTEGNLFISQILHKTYIEVDASGTRAGAATMAITGAGSAPQEEVKQVFLDRPFVYMIVDCEENLPIFIGTLTEIE